MQASRKRRLLLDTLTILATALSAALVRAFALAPTPPRRPPLLPSQKVNAAFNCLHSGRLSPRCHGPADDLSPRATPPRWEQGCCGRRSSAFRLEAFRGGGGHSSCAVERGLVWSGRGGDGRGGRSALLAATIADDVACASVNEKVCACVYLEGAGGGWAKGGTT